MISEPRIVRFGAFEFDPRAGELRKDGVLLKLQDKPLRLLELLLDRPGDLVTREELRQKLWPADVFVNFDSLNNAINRVRGVLGDAAGSPSFIETLGRRGYRFIAPVRLEVREAAARSAAWPFSLSRIYPPPPGRISSPME